MVSLASKSKVIVVPVSVHIHIHEDLHATTQAQSKVQGWGVLPVLNIGLNVIDGVTGLQIESYCRAGQCSHPHPQRSACRAKGKVLDALLVLNCGLEGIDGVTGLKMNRDCRAGQCTHTHPRRSACHQAGEKTKCKVLDALLLLNIGLSVIDGVAGLHILRVHIRIHENLHATTQVKNQGSRSWMPSLS